MTIDILTAIILACQVHGVARSDSTYDSAKLAQRLCQKVLISCTRNNHDKKLFTWDESVVQCLEKN